MEAVFRQVATQAALTAGAHGNAVRNPNGVEPVSNHPRLHNAILDLLGQIKQVHIAGVAFEPHARHTHLRACANSRSQP